MKLGTVVTSLPALQKLAGEALTARTLYQVSKMLKKLDDEIAFFNEERSKLFKDLGEDRGNDQWEILDANRAEFEKRMTDLLSIDIDADFRAVQIPISESLTLSYNDLCLLGDFIELVEPDQNG